MGFHRWLLCIINIVVVIFGAYYIFFADHVSQATSLNQCLRESTSSIQWTGVITSAVAIVGIVGACFKVKSLQCFYLFALLVATVSSVAFCMFVSAMMPSYSAEIIFYTSAETKYWLVGYGQVMQNVVANGRDFSATKKCFVAIDTCRVMANQTSEQKVPFIDYGCCNPPNRCGLVQAPYTGRWVESEYGLNSTDEECRTWVTKGGSCFECDSCKAAYLANYQIQWDNNLSSRVECIMMLMGTLALAYYIFMHDHCQNLIGGDTRKSEMRTNIV